MEAPDHPAADIPTAAQALEPRRHPRGKIASLPRKVRQQLNMMLGDGLTYSQTIAALGDPARNLSVDCVKRWHAGPYQQWIKDQMWLEELSAKLDFAADVLQDPESPKVREASLAIAIKQMYDLLAS